MTTRYTEDDAAWDAPLTEADDADLTGTDDGWNE